MFLHHIADKRGVSVRDIWDMTETEANYLCAYYAIVNEVKK